LPRFFLILIVIVLLTFLLIRFLRLPAKKRKQILKYLVVLTVISGFFAMAVTGRLSWLFALLASIVPLVPRLITWLLKVLPALQPFLQQLRTARSEQRVQMETQYIRMVFNQNTSEMDGEVIKGAYKGRVLSQLSQQELLQFLKDCQQNDHESAAMLMAYMDRYNGGWRETGKSQHQEGFKPGKMSVEEALEILAIKKSATRDEIIEAHKRLMQKIHPDRGGSDYLAAKVNQAKEILLKE